MKQGEIMRPFFDKKQAAKEADQLIDRKLDEYMLSAREEFEKILPPEKVDERLRIFRNKAKVELIKLFREEMRAVRQENIENDSLNKLA